MRNAIYLDHNATTLLKPEVLRHMAEVMQAPYNPASIHTMGREAAKRLEEARQIIASTLGARHARVIFTSSGTEANNLALKGLEGYKKAVSAAEHVSVLAAAEGAEILPVENTGILDLIALENFCKAHEGQNFLVSVMWANNETGVIQPVREIANIIHRYNGLFHSDASQAVGKIPVDMLESGVDMLTISGHKMGGPQGAAALVITKCVPLKAQTVGGGQESGFRAGTHNMAAIIGFGVAVEYIDSMAHVAILRDEMEAVLQAQGAIVIGKESPRLPNTSCIVMPGVKAETQLIHCDLNDIAISAGSACSSGKVGRSHVLQAMDVPEELASCAIRVSLGADTTQKEADVFVAVWKGLYEKNKWGVAA